MIDIRNPKFGSRREWLKHFDVAETAALLQSDVLMLPAGYCQAENAFAAGSADLFKKLRSMGLNIEICATPESYSELSLNSREIRLGKFVVNIDTFGILLGFLTSFIAGEVSYSIHKNDTQSIDFTQPTKVEVTFIVEDTTGVRESKEIKFEGSADDFAKIAESVDNLWQD